jgi:nucleoside-diphosphate-sugar epimerase
VLVTGASGFVGAAMLARLASRPDFAVSAAARRDLTSAPEGVDVVRVGDLGADADWSAAVRGVDVVIHCAARAHTVGSGAALEELRRVNVGGTLALARQARDAGVKRFVLVSSIKVNGEETLPGAPFTIAAPARPQDAYGISKWEAEQALAGVAAGGQMEWTIVRPPLVYGPGVKANFRALLKAVHAGLPLPLGAARNKRSFVALDNLVDLLFGCVTHPAAASQIFLAADDEALSTAELVERVGAALGKPTRLFYVPPAVVRAAATVVGQRGAFSRLFGSLEVDNSHARRVLDWTPAVSIDAALAATAQHFLRTMPRS